MGVMLYKMLALELPWDINGIDDALLKTSTVRYPEIEGNYSPALKNIIQLCLQKSPKQRPEIEALLKTPVINRRIN